MVDSGVEVDFALGFKTEPLVECDGVGLRGEADSCQGAFSSGFYERFHDGDADASVAVGLQDGDAADVAVFEEAAGRDRFFLFESQGVKAFRVQPIDFQFRGDVLLVDEDFEADGENRIGIGFEWCGFDAYHGRRA